MDLKIVVTTGLGSNLSEIARGGPLGRRSMLTSSKTKGQTVNLLCLLYSSCPTCEGEDVPVEP